jgi:hypothetical protein
MKKRTVISLGILFVFICLLTGFSLGSPGLWANHFSHWGIPPFIALLMTLLIGLVLMDDLFELNGSLAITQERLGLKVEIKEHFIWAFLIVCLVSVVLELVQFSDNNCRLSCRYCCAHNWIKGTHEESGV